jgi:hypothetical protein
MAVMTADRWSFSKRIRHAAEGATHRIAVAADINAEVAVNQSKSTVDRQVNRAGGSSRVTAVSTSQDAPIVQHRGKTVDESSSAPGAGTSDRRPPPEGDRP